MVSVLMFPFLLILVGLGTLAVLLYRLLCGEILVVFPSMPGSLGFVHKTRGTVQVLLLVFGPPVARLTVPAFTVVVVVLRIVVCDLRVGSSHSP